MRNLLGWDLWRWLPGHFFSLLNNQHWLNNEVRKSWTGPLEHFGPKILDIILEKATTFLVVNQSREPETASGLVFYPLVYQGIFCSLTSSEYGCDSLFL